MQTTESKTAETAVTYFDSHAEYYDRNQYRSGRRTFMGARQEAIVTLLPQLGLPANPVVLDAGCGPGNLLPRLGGSASRLCAMDASQRMLQLARANSGRLTNVTFQAGSIEALPFASGSFDLVCSAGVIEYLPDCAGALAEMYRVLKPGGLLVLTTTNACAPAHWLLPITRPVARIPAVSRAFGLQAGTFRLRYYFVPRFKQKLRTAGFRLEDGRHFYLTLPRPLDRLLPGVARRLEAVFDRFMQTPVRHLAEGYIAVARKHA